MGELELSRPFDSAVLRAVDEGLAVLGESVRDSIYYHLERSYGIRRDEVPERLEAFHQALRGLLGEGGRTVEAIALLCAGSFPRFESKAPIVRSDLLTYGFLKSIPNMEKVGLLVPNEKQQKPIGREFRDEGFGVVTSWLSPYREGSVEDAVKPFKREDVTLVSLLCMGYTPELKEKVVRLTSKPAVLSQSLLAKAIDELLT